MTAVTYDVCALYRDVPRPVSTARVSGSAPASSSGQAAGAQGTPPAQALEQRSRPAAAAAAGAKKQKTLAPAASAGMHR